MNCVGIDIRRVSMDSECTGKIEQTSEDWKYKRFYSHGIENSVNEALTPFTPLLGLRDVTFIINPASEGYDIQLTRCQANQ
jgi:hypothetical protein